MRHVKKILKSGSSAGEVIIFCLKNPLPVVIRSGQEKKSDGSEKSASFVQVCTICTYEKSLFVTDVAVGTIRLVTSLSRTVAFLKNLGCLLRHFLNTRKRYTCEKGNTEGGERERRQSL